MRGVASSALLLLLGECGHCDDQRMVHVDGVGARRVNARALTEALDAMREPSSLHATLPLFASTGLVDTFKQLANHHVRF